MNIDSPTLVSKITYLVCSFLFRFFLSLTQNQKLSLETKIDVACDCGIELIFYYNSRCVTQLRFPF